MPRSPWHATHPWAISAPARGRRARDRIIVELHATCVVGWALAVLVGCRTAGDPGRMQTARQMAVNASRPAARPGTIGRSRNPNRTEKARSETMIVLAHKRQGL